MVSPPDPEESTLSKDELEVLIRLDEKTDVIQEDIQDVSEKADENAGKIDTVEDDVQRNTVILNGMTAGIGGLFTAGLAKISKFL